MSRIKGSKTTLNAVNKQLGVVPNVYRLIGNSPAALTGFAGFQAALSKALASSDSKANAAVQFAAKVARERGHVNEVAKTDIDFPVVRAAEVGLS